MQAAAFAQLVGDDAQLKWCRDRFKQVLLPNQMGADGSFPRELGRTKPYGYSLFNIDAMAAVCQIASTPDDSLWEFSTSDGRNMRRGNWFGISAWTPPRSPLLSRQPILDSVDAIRSRSGRSPLATA